jgi:iron complex outermembrane receptor protein
MYYEKYGFSARVSNRYRDDFVGEVPQFDATLILQERQCRIAARRTDRLRDSRRDAEGIELRDLGTNLTDEPFVLSNVGQRPVQLRQVRELRAVYAVAVSYSF